MLGWVLAFGVLKSSQFLFQPFVWRNWPLDELLLGWLDVARDNVVVALPIALALMLGLRRARPDFRRRALLALLIVLGATAGQLALVLIGSAAAADGAASLVGRTLAWSLVAACLAGIYLQRRRSMEASAALRRAELRRVQAEQQVAHANMQALRRQIEPHFLFNTLLTVRQLQQSDPAQGARLLANFIDYLRLTLPCLTERRSSLGQELELVRAYLGVVAVRLSGRLRVEWDIPAELHHTEFPPLVLATLVENAIKHGIAPATAGGSLQIAARGEGGVLALRVCDTGVGFNASGGSGIGLANIRARLATLYGDAGRLLLRGNPPHGVCAQLILPLRPPESPA